jgi:predicted flap endonuclease-1-like 5' DNA nuclease
VPAPGASLNPIRGAFQGPLEPGDGCARLRPADIDGKQLNAPVRAAWFSRAPQRLAASLAAAQAAADSPGGDLPAGIGGPATQALFSAGVTKPEQVAQYSRAELLAPHGVGPEAVRVPAEALEQRGLALRGRLGGG